MADTIGPREVAQIAKLAKLALSEDQQQQAVIQLTKILDYVNHVQAVELPDGCEPYFGAAGVVDAVRNDVAQPSWPREEMLRNAPDSDGEYYCVPPVFE